MDRKQYDVRKIDPKPKDRGDVRKIIKVPRKKNDMQTQVMTSKQYLGDNCDEMIKKEFQKELCIPDPMPETNKKQNEKNIAEPQDKLHQYKILRQDPSVLVKSLMDRRRELAKRYTFKNYINNADPVEMQNKKNLKPGDEYGDKMCVAPAESDPIDQYLYIEENYSDRKYEDKPEAKPPKSSLKQKTTPRKPVIKTITRKENATVKVFKSVSFVENKNKVASHPINLQMHREISPRSLSRHKTPNTSNSNSAKSSDTSGRKPLKEKDSNIRNNSPANVTKLTIPRLKKVRGKAKKRHNSPDIPVQRLPSTEVAKWAPQCIDNHTKPYYEAWVNTTLTATTKAKDPKVFLEKQKILQSLQRAVSESTHDLSPEDLSDERYTGKIRVRM